MDINNQKNGQSRRCLKFSAKKNRRRNAENEKLNRSSDVIILDNSFDEIKSDYLKTTTQKVLSPIVINDSSDFSMDNGMSNILKPDKRPSKKGNASFNCSIEDSPLKQIKKPSKCGWPPALNIICTTPKYTTTPSTPKDIGNESIELCSLDKIQQSQKKILNDIYGEVWKSIPKLFTPNGCANFDTTPKKLQFEDEESDKENIRQDLEINKRLYLTFKPKPKVNLSFYSEKKCKKKLYTEKIPNTPEVSKPKTIKRDVNSTTKKVKMPKGLSVTELVNVMNKNVDILVEKVKNVTVAASNETLDKRLSVVKVKNDVVTDLVDNEVKRLSFVGSLADNVPSWRCHPEAIQYIDDYKNLREQLTRRLYTEFNKEIFNNDLDVDMPIVWDSKLRSTAGTTTNRLIKNAKGVARRTSSIKLCSKVVDGPMRLRDTLVHEMCHAATWLIDGELRAGHGPLWKKWASRALEMYPELREISRCHDMAIHFKYTYKCTKCGYSFHRHSKSIDITKKLCGICRGVFVIILNKKNKDGVIVSTPARKGNTNEFALYVKENYGSYKDGRSHAQVMKILGEQFSTKKKNVKVTEEI